MVNPRISLSLNFPQPVTVMSLVLGGWFPLNFTSARTHLIDQNVLIWFRSQSQRAKMQPDYEANRWWLDFLNRPEQTINPVFCALEGRATRWPTFAEFRDEYQKACDVVRTFLPRAKLASYEESEFLTVFNLVKKLARNYDAGSGFLRTVAPMLVDRVGARRLAAATDRILEEAGRFKISDTFLLLAVLSCLHEGPGANETVAAKGVIKPSANYTAARAHNALMDLITLELFAFGTSLGREPIGFCTRDRPLAAFWVQLQTQCSEWNGETCKVSFSPKPEMFPVLNPRQFNELMQKLDLAEFP